MRKMSTVQLVVAAVLVVVGGLAIVAFAGEREVRLEVEQKDGDQVSVTVDDATQVIHLKDLADGEQRTFAAGKRTVSVKRVGDRLVVALDGDQLGLDSEDLDTMLWVEAGDDGARVEKRIVIVTDGGEEAMANAFAIRTCDKGEGPKRVKVVRVRGDEGTALPVEEALAEQVVFRCSDDGTVLRIAKDKATQDTYICPVCGKVMEKAPPSKLKIMTFVGEDEEKKGE